jgi:hypothetical protein
MRSKAQIDYAITRAGIHLSFRAASDVEDELDRLVAIENDCCAWAQWTVTRQYDRVVLEVCSAGDGVAALHGMFLDPAGRSHTRARDSVA